jgi:hypothetical protein|nr:MAG TPA: hypothetical protein [Caudoviricetes sp.]
MIDSVLKGTGNSRFLKSAVPAGTSWADALAMLQAGTFPIDFNGINAEGFQQVGTPLNKANLLKDATAAQIGLPPSTTPDGMFQALGNTGELHVWRKTVTTAQEIPAGYTLENATNQTLAVKGDGGTAGYSLYIYYCSTISVDDNGTVHPGSETSIEFVSSANMDRLNDCKGKFIRMGSGKYSSYTKGEFFIPSDAVFSFTNHILTVNKCQKVNPYPLTPAGTTTTYPVSTNPNAYQEGDDAKPAGYVLGDVVTGRFKLEGYYNSSYPTYYYADNTPTVSDDGVVSVKDIYGFSGYGSGQDALQTRIRWKYIQCRVDDYTQSDFRNLGVVYIPEDAVVLQYNSASGVYIDRYQPVTGYAAIPAGTTIEYLGKLGDKARVQVVSYVGTGTYGSDHPNSLTFDFVPKVVMFLRGYKKGFTQYHSLCSTYDTDIPVIVTADLSENFTSFNGFGYYNDAYAKKDTTGRVISWYNIKSALNQANENGITYYFLAIS